VETKSMLIRMLVELLDANIALRKRLNEPAACKFCKGFVKRAISQEDARKAVNLKRRTRRIIRG